MPQRAKGPRLYLDPRRKQWVIRDGARFVRTKCGEGDSAKAEKFLAQYIGHKHKPEASSAPMIADVLNVYGQEVAPNRATAKDLSYVIEDLLRWWGDKNVAEISAKVCRAYAQGRSPSSAARCIKILRAAVGYWHKEYGPLGFMPSFWRPQESGPRDRWLTRSEVARLLKATRPYRYLRRLVLLQLYTGSRPGVILALQWKQVDLAAGVLVRKLEPQPRNKKSPNVRLGRRIIGHLRRWKRIDGSAQFVCGGYKDPHTSWDKVIEAAGLEGVTRHTLRHTRATWMAQKGVPLFEAAGFLGMSVKTLERVYAHHDPKHQEHAANI